MIQFRLNRTDYEPEQTLGELTVIKEGEPEYHFKTLELPWKDNQSNISCIPKGEYPVKHRTSEKYKEHFIVENTEPRKYILIHSGNFNHHTKGCILLGTKYRDINNDGLLDVINSKLAMQVLKDICKDETEINMVIS